MVKADKTRLETAIEELGKAEHKYEELIRQKRLNKSKVSEKDCQDALQAKRQAKEAVDALRRGLPVPEPVKKVD